MYKHKGMTLIEVLIAGIILFISISAISLVARTKILNQQKLVRNTESAYVAEYAKENVKYHLQHTDIRSGKVKISSRVYRWQATLEKSSRPRRVLDESEGSHNQDLLLLYRVIIDVVDTKSVALEYFELIWEMP